MRTQGNNPSLHRLSCANPAVPEARSAAAQTSKGAGLRRRSRGRVGSQTPSIRRTGLLLLNLQLVHHLLHVVQRGGAAYKTDSDPCSGQGTREQRTHILPDSFRNKNVFYLDLFGGEADGETSSIPGEVYTDAERLLESAHAYQAYGEAARRASQDRSKPPQHSIARVAPDTVSGTITVAGYVQDIGERHALKLMKGTGALGQCWLKKLIGDRESQITIVDSQYQSYTALVDLRHAVLARRSTVLATIRPVHLPSGFFFLCDLLDVLPVRPKCRA